MEQNNGYCVHLQRKFVNKPTEQSNGYQRLSYDLTRQNESSLYEMHRVLEEFCKRSNGEMDYWITDYSKIDGEHSPSIDDQTSIIYSSEKDKS